MTHVGRTAAGRESERDDGKEGRRAAPIVGATVAGSTGHHGFSFSTDESGELVQESKIIHVCVFAANVSA